MIQRCQCIHLVVCPAPKTALEEEVKKVQHPISDW
jgi:hypothetical protein